MVRRLWKRCFWRRSPSTIDHSMLMKPSTLPPPPGLILADKIRFETVIKCCNRPPPHEDSPLLCLYRIYECITIAYAIGYRNEIEYFWNQHQWRVSEIVDPRDVNPGRYAVLACITALPVLAFNNNVGSGLLRSSPAIMMREEIEECRVCPDVEKQKSYEAAPAWAAAVPSLGGQRVNPADTDTVFEASEPNEADHIFLHRNILTWRPNV